MYEFLLWLAALFAPAPAPVTYAEPVKRDYIGMVAAEAAYSAALPTRAPEKPLVNPKDCKNCNGTGKVPSGDGQGWSKCPVCQPMTEETPAKPSMQLQKPTRMPMQVK